MDLIYISGPPSVGKLTVATEVAARTGYKLFHNHLSIGAIEPVFDFGTDAFWELVHELREQRLSLQAVDMQLAHQLLPQLREGVQIVALVRRRLLLV